MCISWVENECKHVEQYFGTGSSKVTSINKAFPLRATLNKTLQRIAMYSLSMLKHAGYIHLYTTPVPHFP
jgi:hypothetical protein